MSNIATKRLHNAISALQIILSILLLALAFLCFCSANWFVSVYGRIGFDAVLFTLNSSLSGASSSLVAQYLLRGLLPALVCTAIVVYLLFFLHRRRRKHTALPVIAAIMLSLGLMGHAAWNVELDDYLFNEKTDGHLFEKYYVDPAETAITFPEEKRNLVYILLESMETSYLSEDLGGAMEENLIPELYDIALENTNFSHNNGVGGFHCTEGATWTIGAMVAQTAGIPLKTPTEDVNMYGQDGSDFLPGVTSLMDILGENGYYQALMVGSDVSFGGRESYYDQHGVDAIYDLYTARADGIVPKDYFVWWGMEDKYLFEYARQELTEIAQQNQPFAFTMLTVDTHHIGGYQCEYCEPSVSGETYDQSISCSSRQVAGFLEWLQQQPFYDNTTVIIVGDHESMDNGYFERMTEDGYQRMVYNCFINAVVETDNSKMRQFAAIDLFPTTLAALGCEIPGDRLGLGTNLYSDMPTLTEKMGLLYFETQMSLSSQYYEDRFYTAQ